MSVDLKSYQIAEDFLRDEPKLFTIENTNELAERVQDVIEDFIEEKSREGNR